MKKRRDERKETGVNAEAEGPRDGDRWKERERKGKSERERNSRVEEFTQAEMKIQGLKGG